MHWRNVFIFYGWTFSRTPWRKFHCSFLWNHVCCLLSGHAEKSTCLPGAQYFLGKYYCSVNLCAVPSFYSANKFFRSLDGQFSWCFSDCGCVCIFFIRSIKGPCCWSFYYFDVWACFQSCVGLPWLRWNSFQLCNNWRHYNNNCYYYTFFYF